MQPGIAPGVTVQVRSSGILLAFLLIHALSVAVTALGITGLPRAWGTAHIAMLSPWVWLAGYGILLAALVPAVRQWLTDAADRLTLGNVPRLACLIAALAALPVLLWILRQKYALLGDGYLRADELDAGTIASAGKIYLTGLQALKTATSLDSVMVFQLVSCLLGVPFLLTLWSFAAALTEDRDQRWHVVALVGTSGTVLFYFGYVESYPPLPILQLAFAACALRAIKGRTRWLAGAAACLVVGILLHPILAFALPSLLWLVGDRIGHWHWRRRFAGGVILLAALALLIIDWQPVVGHLLTPLATDDDTYGLFTWVHMWERGNGILLVAPGAIVILLGTGRDPARRATGRGSTLVFLALLAICGLAADFSLDFILGRLDWDLQAVTLFPLVLLAACLLVRSGPHADGLALLAVTCGSLNAAAWVAVNHTDACFDLVETYLDDEPARYFRTHIPAVRFADYATRAGQPLRAMPVLQQALDDLPADVSGPKTDLRARLHYYIGSAYFDARDFDRAVPAFNAALKENPTYELAFRMLLDSWRRLGHAEWAAGLQEAYHRLLIEQARTYLEQGELESAAAGWEIAHGFGVRGSDLFLQMGITWQRLQRWMVTGPASGRTYLATESPLRARSLQL